jgi:hypothetical protein
MDKMDRMAELIRINSEKPLIIADGDSSCRATTILFINTEAGHFRQDGQDGRSLYGSIQTKPLMDADER